MTISDTWATWRTQDRQVRAAAQERNQQVLDVAVWVLLVLNLLHVLVFSWLQFDEDATRSAWGRHIAWAHGGMALLVGAVGLLSRHLRRYRPGAAVLRHLPALTCTLVLGWSVLLALLDQAVSTNIHPFVNAVMGVAIVFLLRPQVALAILLSGWCALAIGLGWQTNDAALLATNRMNGATASVLALLVSVLLWRRFVQTERLQQALSLSNQQLERQRAELEALATRDALTGMINRREFVRRAELALAQAQRSGAPLSLLMVDLDHFKTVNDTHGHAAGDGVLQHVAARLTQAFRHTDSVARYGGEEFVVMLPDTGQAQAHQLAEKLRLHLAATAIPSMGITVTASVGLATTSSGGSPQKLDTLLARADDALYQAKRQGRNQTVVAPSPHNADA